MGAIATSPFAHRLGRLTPVVDQREITIHDLSLVGRTGFKGAGTTGWLASKVSVLPGEPNRAIATAETTLIVRLGKEEYLVLDNHLAPPSISLQLEKEWKLESQNSVKKMGYLLPRADSHSWLFIEGSCVPQMMAKICGVHLHAEKFACGSVAQTVVARISAVLIRSTSETPYGLHLLTDTASADYVFDVLNDAAAEFGGGFFHGT